MNIKKKSGIHTWPQSCAYNFFHFQYSCKIGRRLALCYLFGKLQKTANSKRATNKPEWIFCEGQCQSWLHRKCAGLTQAVFEEAKKSEKPFHCCNCRLDCQEKEISSLKGMLMKLTTAPSQLQAHPPTTDSPCDAPPPSEDLPASKNSTSYASAASPNKPTNVVTKSPESDWKSNEMKFNLLVFGLEEQTKGTPRSTRIRKKWTIWANFSRIFILKSHVNQRDCSRLRKYDHTRTRPVLVKMSRSHDVQLILYNRSKLTTCSKISIKPDLSFEE